MNLKRTAYILFILIASVYILIVGKVLLIPLVLSILLWFIVLEIKTFARKIAFIKKHIPNWLLNLFSVALLYLVGTLIVNLLINNIQSLISHAPEYQANLNVFKDNITSKYNIDLDQITQSMVVKFDFAAYITDFFGALTNLFNHLFMILLYLLFILLEESIFSNKISALYPNISEENEIRSMLERIGKSIGDYIALKTIVSLITGLASFIALSIIGIDSPLFWAFLIFLLNYIPTIGSLGATALPAIMALLQYGELNPALLVIGIVGAIQVITGNIIEPRLMGNSLNISGFVVILALSFWGAIWGVIGMILSVPITVIIVILLSQFEGTKSIAILLSEKGKINGQK